MIDIARTACAAPAIHQTPFLRDVLRGLSRPQKSIPSKYFYDARGAELFEQICTLDEYYPTRAELQIMQMHARGMAVLIGRGAIIIEPGSGAGIKTRLLLEALEEPAAYIPIDISRQQLESTAADIARDFPDLAIHPIHADFASRFSLPSHTVRRFPRARRRAIYFPGSTIGNFDPPDAVSLLKRFAALAGPRGALLIGFDLIKDRRTLELAYNDRRGITAEFNLNLLHRLRSELGAEVNPDRFQHRAIYNEHRRRIEMHLISLDDQTITLAGHTFTLRRGETIHTENSYKHTPAGFRALLRASAWRTSPAHTWLDPHERFAVMYAER